MGEREDSTRHEVIVYSIQSDARLPTTEAGHSISLVERFMSLLVFGSCSTRDKGKKIRKRPKRLFARSIVAIIVGRESPTAGLFLDKMIK